jgi:tetratricopeptide (TPR) repeat protein
LNGIAIRAFHEGRWRDALGAYSQAQEVSEQAGDHWNAATASANIAEILAYQGRLQEASDMLHRAMRVWRAADALSEVAFGTYQLGRIAARLGRHEQALVLFGQAREFFQTHGEQSELLEVDALVTECYLLARRPSEALELAGQTLARAAALTGLAAPVPLLHRVRGGAYAATGELGLARTELVTSLAAARLRQARHEIAFSLDALLALPGGVHPEELPECLRERAELMSQLDVVTVAEARAPSQLSA